MGDDTLDVTVNDDEIQELDDFDGEFVDAFDESVDDDDSGGGVKADKGDSKKTGSGTEKKADDDDDDETGDDDKDKDKKPPSSTDKDKEKKTEASDDKEGDKKTEKQPEKELTAKERAEKRAEALTGENIADDGKGDGGKTPAGGADPGGAEAGKKDQRTEGDKTRDGSPAGSPPADQTKQTGQQPQVQPTGKLTKEQIAGFMGMLGVDDLPDGNIHIGNEEINLKEFAEDFPEQFQAISVMSGAIAQKIVSKAIESGQLMSPKAIQEIQARQQKSDEALGFYMFWHEVNKVHSDGEAIIKTKEFQDWVGSQSNLIQKLAESGNPDDAIALFDFYKEEQAKAAAKKHDDDKRDKQNKKNDLHKHTTRSKQAVDKGGGDDKDDFKAGFDEEAD